MARGHTLSPTNKGASRVQPAYKIDTSLVSPLGALPEFTTPGTNTSTSNEINILALRNLKRGVALGLPSGQDVARSMGMEPLADDQLFVGKANADGIHKNKSIRDLSPAFKEKAPLWFYVLSEAQHSWLEEVKKRKTDDEKNSTPVRLGPVGGRIVGEVLIGLLLGDPQSFLNVDSHWTPLFGNPKAPTVFDRFNVGDLFEAVLHVA